MAGAISVGTLSFATDTNSLIAATPSPTETQDNVEFTIGPVFAPAPELTVRPDVPKGAVYDFTMNSEESTAYPGIAKNKPGVVPYVRNVCVYVPQQYVPGNPAPFIVVQDGVAKQEAPDRISYCNALPKILDNMIYDHRLPVMIAVMINSGGGDGKGSERGLEYDTVSGAYAMFIETEVLTRIAHDYNVTFTKDPQGRATMGGSSGGAAAFTMAWFHPELYGRVLTYSGTYVDQQSPFNPESPHGAWEYHEHLILQSEQKPLRVWLEVGDHDNGANMNEASRHNWLLANKRMAAALKAKGYTYRFVLALNGRHNDIRIIRQTLPGALEWLWQDYTDVTY
jgi:enterochelin esterase family protein